MHTGSLVPRTQIIAFGLELDKRVREHKYVRNTVESLPWSQAWGMIHNAIDNTYVKGFWLLASFPGSPHAWTKNNLNSLRPLNDVMFQTSPCTFTAYIHIKNTKSFQKVEWKSEELNPVLYKQQEILGPHWLHASTYLNNIQCD